MGNSTWQQSWESGKQPSELVVTKLSSSCRERGGGKMSQREMEWRRRGGSLKDRQIKGSLSNESKLTEMWLQLPV